MKVEREVIKDFYGRVQGYVETDRSGNKQVYDFYRRKLGFYRKSTNTTHDFYGRVVARGDKATSLIKDNSN